MGNVERMVTQRFIGLLFDHPTLTVNEITILCVWLLQGLPDPREEPLEILSNITACTFQELLNTFKSLVKKDVLVVEGDRYKISETYKEEFKKMVG